MPSKFGNICVLCASMGHGMCHLVEDVPCINMGLGCGICTICLYYYATSVRRPVTRSTAVVFQCGWLGHLTRKIIPEMTYDVPNATLNPTTQYHTEVGCEDERVSRYRV